MRISRVLTTKKELRVKDLIKSDSTLSVKEINERVKREFGQSMSVNRIYELKNEVLNGVNSVNNGNNVSVVDSNEVAGSRVVVGS